MRVILEQFLSMQCRRDKTSQITFVITLNPFKIIFLNNSYDRALTLAKEEVLADRKVYQCKRFMRDMKRPEHPRVFLMEIDEHDPISYNLRPGRTKAS